MSERSRMVAIFVAVLPMAACSSTGSDNNGQTTGKSGLPTTLVLSKATDAEKLRFCQWLASAAPADACGAPSAAADGGGPATTDGGASAGVELCLGSFSGFNKDCTVQATEQCFSSWEKSGACEMPAQAACQAYVACSEPTPPENGEVEVECWGTIDAAHHPYQLAIGGKEEVSHRFGQTTWTVCNNVLWVWFDLCGEGKEAAQKCASSYPDCGKFCHMWECHGDTCFSTAGAEYWYSD